MKENNYLETIDWEHEAQKDYIFPFSKSFTALAKVLVRKELELLLTWGKCCKSSDSRFYSKPKIFLLKQEIREYQFLKIILFLFPILLVQDLK